MFVKVFDTTCTNTLVIEIDNSREIRRTVKELRQELISQGKHIIDRGVDYITFNDGSEITVEED